MVPLLSEACLSVSRSSVVFALSMSTILVLARRLLIGGAGVRERWCRRGRWSQGSWRATERSNVGVQVGQLQLEPLDVPSEPPGHELLLRPEPGGPIQDAPALAEVLLQGLDSFLKKSVLGQGLQVIYTWPPRHGRCRCRASTKRGRHWILLLADGWCGLLA